MFVDIIKVFFKVTCHRQWATKLSTQTSERARFGHFAHIMWTRYSRAEYSKTSSKLEI